LPWGEPPREEFQLVSAKLGIGKETLRGWARHAQIDAGSGANSEEIAQIRDLRSANRIWVEVEIPGLLTQSA